MDQTRRQLIKLGFLFEDIFNKIRFKKEDNLTTLLKKAFETVSKLPELEQNTLARWIIDELAADKKWANSFGESEDILEKLADEALEFNEQGKTSNLNIDKL